MGGAREGAARVFETIRGKGRRRAIALAVVAGALAGGPLCSGGAWNPFGGESHPTAVEQFEYAQMLEKEEKYNLAMDSYQKVSDAFPSSPLAAEAQFRVGAMLEKTRNFYAAFNAYQAVLDTYPSYPKVNLILERQLRIGNLFLQGKEIGFLKINPAASHKRSIGIFRKILSNAPFSDLAPRAQYNLGLAHLNRKEYVEATIELEKIPMRYPYSEHVPSAKFQLGVCAYRQAKAAPYDQEAAQEALNRLREYIGEFPGDRSTEIAKNMLIELRSRRAEALYRIGSFYEERGNPKAALIYFREVIRDYPLTPYAEKARRVARREEKKMELVDASRKAGQTIDELSRRIRGHRREAKRIKTGGAVEWRFWRHVIPRRLSPEEKAEFSKLTEKCDTLADRLSFARIELEEKRELLGNRARLLAGEAEIEKLEDELRAAQVELQVSQNRLSEIGDLPDSESPILEEAAVAIARQEGQVRRIETLLDEKRIALDSLGRETEKDEQFLKREYKEKREQLKSAIAKRLSRAVPAGSRPPGESGDGEPILLAGTEDPSAGSKGLFGRLAGLFSKDSPDAGDEGVVAKCEEAYREALGQVQKGDDLKEKQEWNEAMENYDRASLRLMELKEAWPAYRRGDVDQALKICSDGLAGSRAESDRQQYEELAKELGKRIKENPDNADAHFSLAVLSQEHGDSDRAVREYGKTIEIRPRRADAYHNLAVVLGGRGDVPEAADALRKAIELDPSDATAHHNLGVVSKDLGDYEAAREAFERALELDPSFAPAYFTLGYLYNAAFGDREKAVACWEKYLELSPDDPQAPRLRDWIEQVRREGAQPGFDVDKSFFPQWLIFWDRDREERVPASGRDAGKKP